ncbi:MAG: prephenate dehydrogenase/arogenate dehydrogenase family protein [Acidobacteria bacterium]|nr:prephenate dehydrogenase/arogenate dehydrogenase family protein [Acidobacteriota bacterium]
MATRPGSAESRRPTVPRLLKGAAIGIIGAGQIGGSIVRCLSRRRPALTVCVFDLDRSLGPKIRPFARVCRALDILVRESDVVVLAVPVQTAIRLLPRIARLTDRRSSRRRLIVCDTSTVKAAVIAAAARHRADFDFVGLHPLAGTEGQGWGSSDAGLFKGRRVVICPAGRRASRVARELIGLVGGVPIAMDAGDHDRLAAEGIGLPHVLAFAAAGLGARAPGADLLKGGSWRSLTRVAASSPAMVAGFLHQNRDHQLRVLALFTKRLDAVARALGRPTVCGLERRLAAWQPHAGTAGRRRC